MGVHAKVIQCTCTFRSREITFIQFKHPMMPQIDEYCHHTTWIGLATFFNPETKKADKFIKRLNKLHKGYEHEVVLVDITIERGE